MLVNLICMLEGSNMQQIQLPDPFLPLIAGLQSLANSMNQGQEQMQQQFRMQQDILQESIENVLEKDEAIRELERRSEDLGAEISGVMFIDDENDVVEEIHIDSIGDMTSVDLSIARIPTDDSLKIYSFHSHPRYANPNFSIADLEVARNRTWESGHCVITEINDQFVANCMEI